MARRLLTKPVQTIGSSSRARDGLKSAYEQKLLPPRKSPYCGRYRFLSFVHAADSFIITIIIIF